jgi:hypothetical protein
VFTKRIAAYRKQGCRNYLHYEQLLIIEYLYPSVLPIQVFAKSRRIKWAGGREMHIGFWWESQKEGATMKG